MKRPSDRIDPIVRSEDSPGEEIQTRPSKTDDPSPQSTPEEDTIQSRLESLTFSQIIEADHFTIEQLAALLRRPDTPIHRLRPLLDEVTWRLIRHDVSEELVMRPAFEAHMGDEGRSMAEHDRLDHERARASLLPLLDLDLEGDVASRSDALGVIAAVFDELAEHMNVESGVMVPRLQSLLSVDTSRAFSRAYARTLVLTPNVSVLESSSRDSTVGQRRKCFTHGVREFVYSELDLFKSIFAAIEAEAASDDRWLRERMREELQAIKIGKWTSFQERQKNQGSERDNRKGRL